MSSRIPSSISVPFSRKGAKVTGGAGRLRRQLVIRDSAGRTGKEPVGFKGDIG